MRAVLTYHSIDSSGSAISVSEAEFRRHVEWLASGPVAVAPLETLVGTDTDSDAVALTFDDAFLNFGTIAGKLLRDYGLPATLFVVTERVGGTNAWEANSAASAFPVLPLLDWGGIASAAEDGVAIGSHGKTHRRLPGLEREDLDAEVSGSLDDFRRELGMSPTAFCYPYGDVTERERDAVAKAYRMAVTTELRPLETDLDPFKVPRIDAYYLRGRGRLESFGTPAFERYLSVRRRGRTIKNGVERLLGRE